MAVIGGGGLGKCPTCGKEVIVRDVRAKEATYCSRICAANKRYQLRYRGSNAGPADRPKNFEEKKKF